jgi:Fe-S-cluster containining protein
MSGTHESCTCVACRNACKHKPGWFLPGEAERAAELLGISLEVFFRDFLAVDRYKTEDEWIHALSPAIGGEPAGREMPFYPVGTCVFLDPETERCKIHAAKPFECRVALLCAPIAKEDAHEKAALGWRDHQEQIASLLGREPASIEPKMADLIRMLERRDRIPF